MRPGTVKLFDVCEILLSVHLQVDCSNVWVTFPCKQLLDEGPKEVLCTSILLIYLVMHQLSGLQTMLVDNLSKCLLKKTSAQLSMDLQQWQTH